MLKYVLYTDIVQYLEFQAIFTRETKDLLIRQLRMEGKMYFKRGKPIACVQSAGKFIIYTIRTVDHFTKEDIESFSVDNEVFLERLHHLSGERLLMFTE